MTASWCVNDGNISTVQDMEDDGLTFPSVKNNFACNADEYADEYSYCKYFNLFGVFRDANALD